MRNRRKNKMGGFRRAAVSLLAFVMLLSVCFPGFVASAETAEQENPNPAVQPLVEQPVVEDPQEPVVEDPQEPVVEDPQEPVVEDPQEPVVEDPQEPVVEQPQEPALTEFEKLKARLEETTAEVAALNREAYESDEAYQAAYTALSEKVAQLDTDIIEAYDTNVVSVDEYTQLANTLRADLTAKAPVDPADVEEEEAPTDPTETDPVETDPAETDPAETDPAETDPAETDPAETDPAETDPVCNCTPVNGVHAESCPLYEAPEVDTAAVDALFQKLMAFETYEALDDYMSEEMTNEEYSLMNQFSDEQNETLKARVAELSSYEQITFDTIEIVQGASATYTQAVEADDYIFRIEKDGQTVSSEACGITVTNEGNHTIKITTDKDTPVGDYTIRFGKYQWFGFVRYFSEAGSAPITVTERTVEDTPVTESKKMTFDKTAYLKENGNYELQLTLSGAVGSKTDPAKVDIVLVIDSSGSMKGDRLPKAKTAANSLISALADNENIDPRFNIVTFAGTSSYSDGHTVNYGTEYSGWTNSTYTASAFIDNISAGGATNYEAGLTQAQNQLQNARSGAITIVVFLTDGLPTLRASNYVRGNGSYGYGNGQEDNYNVNLCMNAAKIQVAKMAMHRFYVIGTGTANADNLNELASAATLANYKAVKYTSDSDLEKTFEDIAADISTFLCEDVTITDQLSHVGGNTAVDQMVKVTNPDTVIAIVKKGDEVLGSGKVVSLAATEMNDGAKVEASYNAETGVLTLDFEDDYQLEPDYTYILSAEIAPTEKAYEVYRESGYDEVGQSNTGTHSGQFGFYCNDEAIVTYTYDGAESKEFYSHPVIQLDPGTLVINKTITGDVDTAELKDLAFDVTITYPGKAEEIRTVPFSQFKDADGDETYTHTISGLSPNTQYTVTETGFEVEGYNVETTVTGADKVEGIIASGTVEKGATETVKFVNSYTLANTVITLDKVVTGNLGDWSKEFTFNVAVDGVSLEPIKLTHQSEVAKIEVPIGAEVTITESGNEGYTVSATVDREPVEVENSAITFTASSPKGHAVVFTNRNEAVIETGVTTNSFPVILLFSTVTVLGAVLLIGKRRYEF